MNILLGFTGSVAAILHPKIVEAFKPFGEIRCITTKSGSHFVDLKQEQKSMGGSDSSCDWLFEKDSYSHQSGFVPNMDIVNSFPLDLNKPVRANVKSSTKIHRDEDEWHWAQMGDEILHIQLRKWADVFVIAPLSANTLGKLANGLCDNLLTSVARAWDWSKPMVVAPSMNSHMWDHPITHKQINEIKGWGVSMVEPIAKTLACGDSGVGAMAKIEDITGVAKFALYCRCAVILEQIENHLFDHKKCGYWAYEVLAHFNNLQVELLRYQSLLPLLQGDFGAGEERLKSRYEKAIGELKALVT